MDWARQLGLFEGFEDLNRFEAAPAIARGLAFVPALSGLACPHWDRSAGAVWIGMSAATGRRDMIQSVLEGIALRAAEVIVEMNAQVAITGPIRVDGGVAQSDYFVQFLADVLGREVMRMDFGELTALGCAQLAGPGLARPQPGGGRAAQASGRMFKPGTAAGSGWVARFSDAVARSKNWR